MTSDLEEGVVISCDINKKFTRRYLLLRGSLLWISKQRILLDDRSYKKQLTGREEYFTVCVKY